MNEMESRTEHIDPALAAFFGGAKGRRTQRGEKSTLGQLAIKFSDALQLKFLTPAPLKTQRAPRDSKQNKPAAIPQKRLSYCLLSTFSIQLSLYHSLAQSALRVFASLREILVFFA